MIRGQSRPGDPMCTVATQKNDETPLQYDRPRPSGQRNNAITAPMNSYRRAPLCRTRRATLPETLVCCREARRKQENARAPEKHCSEAAEHTMAHVTRKTRDAKRGRDRNKTGAVVHDGAWVRPVVCAPRQAPVSLRPRWCGNSPIILPSMAALSKCQNKARERIIKIESAYQCTLWVHSQVCVTQTAQNFAEMCCSAHRGCGV